MSLKFFQLGFIIFLMAIGSCSKKSGYGSRLPDLYGLPKLAENDAPSSQRLAVEAALSQSKVSGRPLLIKVTGAWCPPCFWEKKLFEKLRSTNPGHALLSSWDKFDHLVLDEVFYEKVASDFLSVRLNSYPSWVLFHPKTNQWLYLRGTTLYESAQQDFAAQVLDQFAADGLTETSVQKLISSMGRVEIAETEVAAFFMASIQEWEPRLRSIIPQRIKMGGTSAFMRNVNYLLDSSFEDEAVLFDRLKTIALEEVPSLKDDSDVLNLQAFNKNAVRFRLVFDFARQHQYQKIWDMNKVEPVTLRAQMAGMLNEWSVLSNDDAKAFLTAEEQKLMVAEKFNYTQFAAIIRAHMVRGIPTDLAKASDTMNVSLKKRIDDRINDYKKILETAKSDLPNASTPEKKAEINGEIQIYEGLLEVTGEHLQHTQAAYAELFDRLKTDALRPGAKSVHLSQLTKGF
jgi:thiol-disulfide isomerase/thioredoxin